MELGEDDIICGGVPKKVCKNCESSTRECTTGHHYCCDVSWLRMSLYGPRLVSPMDTCAKFAVSRQLSQRGR